MIFFVSKLKMQKQIIPTEDEKQKAFKMKAEITIYSLMQIAEIINLSSTRGAFKANELSQIGTLYDKITSGIDNAFKLIREKNKDAIPEEGEEELKITDLTDN